MAAVTALSEPTGPTLRAAEKLSKALRGEPLFARLRLIREAVHGRIVFTTSFGIEDQAIAHAIFSQRLPIDVVTFDTGRLFPETYDVWAQTERRYDLKIRAFYPERQAVETLVARQGIDGFRSSIVARQACCGIRKIEPLKRALSGAAAWITGLRAEQSNARSHTDVATNDPIYGVIKAAPLADWSRADVTAYVVAESIPHNVLHNRGFLSIGCAPCTRAVEPGEPERAGRWWWESESNKECGLHDNPRRAAVLAAAERQV
jgi:phosphoadenosine phosphosulfate reductase